jgi:hypothetical protein
MVADTSQMMQVCAPTMSQMVSPAPGSFQPTAPVPAATSETK